MYFLCYCDAFSSFFPPLFSLSISSSVKGQEQCQQAVEVLLIHSGFYHDMLQRKACCRLNILTASCCCRGEVPLSFIISCELSTQPCSELVLIDAGKLTKTKQAFCWFSSLNWLLWQRGSGSFKQQHQHKKEDGPVQLRWEQAVPSSGWMLGRLSLRVVGVGVLLCTLPPACNLGQCRKQRNGVGGAASAFCLVVLFQRLICAGCLTLFNCTDCRGEGSCLVHYG